MRTSGQPAPASTQQPSASPAAALTGAGTGRGDPAGAASGTRASGARVPVAAWVIGACFAAIELAVSGRFGFQQDELYFLVAGQHLAFGYVDQPPLAPLLTRITDVLGVSPAAVRIVPALAGGAVVVAAAKLAALFGAGRPGRVLAALAMACAPVLLGADHIGNTTPLDLLAWTLVLVSISIAVQRDRPRWWLLAGAAAGVGLEADNLVILLLASLLAGALVAPGDSAIRRALGSRWPWLGAAIALALWAPNLIWQAASGWPQLAMSAALHRENTSPADYAAGLPAQLLYAGLFVTPLLVAGLVRLWRSPELRFLAVATALVAGYVVAWIPGKAYYADGMLPVVLAAGAAATEAWISRGRERVRQSLAVAAPLAGFVLFLPLVLPLVPVTAVHSLPASAQGSQIGDTIGWPQLTATVATQTARLTTAGQRPSAIFAGYYGEAAALQVLGGSDHLPPVLSGQNAYWMWGPGRVADTTVLAVDALPRLRPFFRSCRLLATYRAPDQVHNDWTPIPIGVCTGPRASWAAIWPRLKYYG